MGKLARHCHQKVLLIRATASEHSTFETLFDKNEDQFMDIIYGVPAKGIYLSGTPYITSMIEIIPHAVPLLKVSKHL
jgi:hypothetical protein